mmetsp:Transcript_85680/g.256648  ORF Transcript_85680/g.256648 Transcript_85680/m.256648 type:complete len:206 (-) Transcript_85680:727-1344(-)
MHSLYAPSTASLAAYSSSVAATMDAHNSLTSPPPSAHCSQMYAPPFLSLLMCAPRPFLSSLSASRPSRSVTVLVPLSSTASTTRAMAAVTAAGVGLSGSASSSRCSWSITPPLTSHACSRCSVAEEATAPVGSGATTRGCPPCGSATIWRALAVLSSKARFSMASRTSCLRSPHSWSCPSRILAKCAAFSKKGLLPSWLLTAVLT